MAFNLRHTFDEPISAEKSATDNLMDYNQKTELWKHQWKFIHNPKNLWFSPLQKEAGGEAMDIGKVFSDLYIKFMKKSGITKLTDLSIQLSDTQIKTMKMFMEKLGITKGCMTNCTK